MKSVYHFPIMNDQMFQQSPLFMFEWIDADKLGLVFGGQTKQKKEYSTNKEAE